MLHTLALAPSLRRWLLNNSLAGGHFLAAQLSLVTKSVNNMDVRLEDVREPEMTMLLKLNWI
ncbi:hypothetical protein WN943_002249 [Citrus x changshan-huyou]